jgi:UrcA family protein
MTKLATKMLLLSGLAGLAAAGTAGAAGASAVPGDAPALAVSFSTELLATDGGARALYQRLARAAEQVCPPQPTESRIIPALVQKCRAQAIADAVNKIHNQRLAAVHAASSKSG